MIAGMREPGPQRSALGGATWSHWPPFSSQVMTTSMCGHCLPPEYWANVNVEPPFDRRPGDPPALNENEIDDIVAFLGTLTDGYRGKSRGP
jgi:hypothetical protein